jgi:hypothetical protein
MSISKSLSSIFISLILSIILLVIFLFFMDPFEAGLFGTGMFFLTLFLFLSSFFTLFFGILKLRRANSEEKMFNGFVSAFRRAVFLSLLSMAAIALKLLGVIYWWNILLLLLFFILLELIFSLRQKKIIYLNKDNAS